MNRILSALLILCCLFAGAPMHARDLVDLNAASQAELETLPGIGPARARAIIEFREQHGPFKRIEDLDNVKGFGKATIDKLAPRVRLSAPHATTDLSKETLRGRL